ncbi:hypothetical protein [Massilia consociata]|uniref:Uncharacterized protein n=1 Tax=Massilia consociata TaxID=760117 RepID=A0ABV6FCC0_9BURK
MGAKKSNAALNAKVQEVCIDLPGERVQCWRSSDNVKVILRKHRDVIFDINLKADTTYTVESKSEFYSPREKKLLRKANFFDGERFQIWVGREFKGELVLSVNGAVIGRYKVIDLDATSYGADPKEKPEPLLIVLGQSVQTASSTRVGGSPTNYWKSHQDIFAVAQPKMSILTTASYTRFDYLYPPEPPVVKDYVAVADVKPDEIRPDVLMKLEAGPVTGKPGELFSASPKNGLCCVNQARPA